MAMEGENLAQQVWLGNWASQEDDPSTNYSGDHKLMEGALIKLGDYARFRYFILYRNGRLCYYELPLPSTPGAAPVKRVHLTLTGQHLRGVMMLNASVHAKETVAGTDDEFEAELIKRGMLFNRRKLELHVTGYSPTGQLMSWQLRAASDQAYRKWERALRVAMRPIWVQNTPSCLICQRTFTFFFRPHHCRKCGTCMCDECSVFVPRLPIQGYYEQVRICRDCSPVKVRKSALKMGTRVLVYGIFPGRVLQVDAADDSDDSKAFVQVALDTRSPMQSIQEENNVEQEEDSSTEDESEGAERQNVRRFSLEFVELYSEAVLSANRIKSAIRLHLSQTLFRTQLNFSTWNLLEQAQEQETVQMVRILNKSTSMNELSSMVPSLGSFENTYSFPSDDTNEQEQVKASLEHYRGIHVTFPLRLELATKLIDQFRNGIQMHRVYVHQILEESEKMLRQVHPCALNEIQVPTGVTLVVVGDLHGQLEDLLTIFDQNGVPSSKLWYLFNGDFVDRGSHGVEVMILLLVFKCLYPEYVFLNRGNHEEQMINEVFGFEDEVFIKYNTENDEIAGWDGLSASPNYSPQHLFQMFEEVFLRLPIVSLVNESVLITHGGLSSLEGVTIDEIRAIPHNRSVPTQSDERADILFTDLLWSDPREMNGHRPSTRGAGVEFGSEITKRFCADNKLNLIIRSHECCEQGYEIAHEGLMLTIFSASNYCGSQTNKGAVASLEVGSNGQLKPHVTQFYSKPLQKLQEAGKNEWRQKAIRLQHRTLVSLVELICEKRNPLLTAFYALDKQRRGRVSKLEWKETLTKVLGLDIPFLLYFNQLAQVEQDSLGGVDYLAFLNRYHVQLDANGVDWKKELVRNVWMGFWHALKQTSETPMDGRTPDERLHAAFNLFQAEPLPPGVEAENGEDATPQKNNAYYSSRGLVTYDVFRTTLQEKLELNETLSDQQIFELMQHMDEDKDGLLSFEEFASFFADFSRLDFLPQLFDLDDARAVELLHRFGSKLQDTSKSLEDVFNRMDRHKTKHLDAQDIRLGADDLDVQPKLTEEDANLLVSAIQRSFHGITRKNSTSSLKEEEDDGVEWSMFQDVFSLDSTEQRKLWMTSLSASGTNLAALDQPASGGGEAWRAAALSPRRGRNSSWVEALVASVKHSLLEQRLYLKFIFRALDWKRKGVVPRDKFVSVMKYANDAYGCPLQTSQLEQLADAFVRRAPPRSKKDLFADTPEQERIPDVSYTALLQQLRAVEST